MKHLIIIAMTLLVFGNVEAKDYGYREDGSKKGSGFLGEIQNTDGTISTELSIEVDIDGVEISLPLLVPTLTINEIRTLQTLSEGQEIPDKIIDKAIDHAITRLNKGLSPFK